jgi:hypothetical protein
MAYNYVVKVTGQVALQKYSISPRFAVLIRMGLIRECGQGPCPLTGQTTTFYEATLTRPVMAESEALKAPRQMGRADLKLIEENRALKEEIAALKELLQVRSAGHKYRDDMITRAPVPVQTAFAL